MNLCKDCKHISVPVTGIEFAKCERVVVFRPNPVTGEQERSGLKYCSTHREIDLSDYCGPTGRFWEAACAS